MPGYENLIDVPAWTNQEAVSKLEQAVIVMTQLVEDKQESAYFSPDAPIPSPKWDEVGKMLHELAYLPERIDRKMPEAEHKSALRASEMITLASQSLFRMRKHAAWSESTVNGVLLQNTDKLRALASENEGQNDVFARFISEKFLPFYRLHMINAIRRNAPRIPGGSDGSNLDIDKVISPEE